MSECISADSSGHRVVISLDTLPTQIPETSVARGRAPRPSHCPTGFTIRRPRPAEPPAGETRTHSEGISAQRQCRNTVSKNPSPKTPAPEAPPGAHAAANALFRLALEVLDRKRPATHLAPCATRLVVEQVALVAQRRRPCAEQAKLLRVHVRPAAPGSAEAFCTYQRGDRVLALAARLDSRPGTPSRWLCTSLRVIA